MIQPGDPRHGTSNGYTNLKCRCDACRAAWAAYKRDCTLRLGPIVRARYSRRRRMREVAAGRVQRPNILRRKRFVNPAYLAAWRVSGAGGPWRLVLELMKGEPRRARPRAEPAAVRGEGGIG